MCCQPPPPVDHATRAGICRTCPSRDREGDRACAGYITLRVCPEGRHPPKAGPESGIVRWPIFAYRWGRSRHRFPGWRWIGLPFPLRLQRWWQSRRPLAYWPGCGCLLVPHWFAEEAAVVLLRRRKAA